MRRGRMIGGLSAILAAAALAAAGGASAATPIDICRDLADGHLDGTYTQAEFEAYQSALQHDPTIQGYCSPLVVIIGTGGGGTTTVENNTTTVVNAGTTTIQNGATTTVAANGTTTTTAGTTTSGVAGATKTKGGPGATTGPTGVLGSQKTKSTPTPLATTKTSGTLPFTGVQLLVFAIVGGLLLAGGVLLRLTARQKRTGP